MSEFKLSCPNCLSPHHAAYRLTIPFDRVIKAVGLSKEILSCRLDCGEVYGESMRHCRQCGLKFPATSGLELRALAPTTPHNERRIAERDLSEDGDRSWSRV